MLTTIRLACAALALMAAAPGSHAGVLFDSTFNGPNDGSSPKPANAGAGQTLAFDPSISPQPVGSFGFLLTAAANTTFKFLIFGGKTTQLFEINRTTSTALNRTLFMSPEFNFLIPQANQYTFAVVADKAFSIDYDTQSRPLTQNGITEMVGQNANYVGFSTPLYSRDGLAEIKMVLNSPVVAVPEASSAVLLGLGLLGIGAFLRRRS